MPDADAPAEIGPRLGLGVAVRDPSGRCSRRRGLAVFPHTRAWPREPPRSKVGPFSPVPCRECPGHAGCAAPEEQGHPPATREPNANRVITDEATSLPAKPQPAPSLWGRPLGLASSGHHPPGHHGSRAELRAAGPERAGAVDVQSNTLLGTRWRLRWCVLRASRSAELGAAGDGHGRVFAPLVGRKQHTRARPSRCRVARALTGAWAALRQATGMSRRGPRPFGGRCSDSQGRDDVAPRAVRIE